MLIDQHMHTTYSNDGRSTMIEYIEQGYQALTFTDHYDLCKVSRKGIDITFNFKEYFEEIEYLSKKYNKVILKGIEVGYHRTRLNEIMDAMEGYEFDVVLMSIHQNEEIDYMHAPKVGEDSLEVLKEYYSRTVEALNSPLKADILTHIDYVLRRRPISLEEIKTVEPYIHKVLSTIIKLDMSLELNTRSIYEYGTSYDYYMYIIDEYRKLGGYKFTLGSDAHHKDYLQYKFPEMVSVLKEMGINEIYYYKQRKPVRVKL